MLRSWWSAEGLPKLDQLGSRQALVVIDRIAELDYATRPFVEGVA